MNKNKNRKYALRRGVFILPTLCTIGTIFCGFYSITSVMGGEFDQAAIAIGIAVVFDGMDGRIARLTNSSSAFGVQIDSFYLKDSNLYSFSVTCIVRKKKGFIDGNLYF